MSSGCRAIDLMPLVASSYGESGMCFDPTDESQVAELLFAFNQVLPLLMNRLDAKNTISEWEEIVQFGTFGLPYDCVEVRQVFLNGRSLTLRDRWYEGRRGYKFNTGNQCCGSMDLVDMGDGYATPSPWPAHMQDARYGIMAESDEDAGTEVQIKGKDRYGNYVEETLTALPYQQVASTQSALTDLTFQHKGITTGAIVGFVTFPNQPNLRILRIPANVESPSYRRKKVPTAWGGCSGVVSIIGKKRFIPLTKATDEMPICNVAAISWGLQALSAMKRKDTSGYVQGLELSLNELIRELNDSSPAGVVTQARVQSPLRFGCKGFN